MNRLFVDTSDVSNLKTLSTDEYGEYVEDVATDAIRKRLIDRIKTMNPSHIRSIEEFIDEFIDELSDST